MKARRSSLPRTCPRARCGCTTRRHRAGKLVLAEPCAPQFPIPIGVLAKVEAPIYEDLIAEQEQRAMAERGPGDIARLLTSGDTWTIR